MRSNTIPRSGLALLVALSVLAPSLAGSQSRWENHVDPSLIKEIVSRDDKLYVATFGGLLVYDIAADRFTQYTNTSGLTTISLTTLVFDPSGRLYVGSDDFGIARVTISGGKLELQRSFNQRFDGLADNRILSLAVWGDSVVYGAATGMGTIHNDFASTALRIQDGLPAESVKDIFPHGEVVWVATDGGVVVLDRQGFLLPVPGAPAEANVFGSDGPTVFVGTDAGVMRFDPADSSWTDLGLSTRKVDSFFYDGQSMWGAGRFLLWNYSGSGQTWAEARMDSFVGQYALGGGIVEADIVVASNGDVYMGIGQQADGARGANLIRFDGIISTNLVPDAPSGNAIRRLSFDAANGDLWASFANFYAGKLTESGTWFNYNESIPASDSMSNGFANIAFLAASDGSKWFATTPGSGTIPLDRLMDNRDTDYSN
ncbi:MAG: hypothetical protein IH969_08965, partial [Candidatus Krumholzibacteriota bacterium]|nr:hypothetical protein [Candidatus Krumholzibacteriota bacterium]